MSSEETADRTRIVRVLEYLRDVSMLRRGRPHPLETSAECVRLESRTGVEMAGAVLVRVVRPQPEEAAPPPRMLGEWLALDPDDERWTPEGAFLEERTVPLESLTPCEMRALIERGARRFNPDTKALEAVPGVRADAVVVRLAPHDRVEVRFEDDPARAELLEAWMKHPAEALPETLSDWIENPLDPVAWTRGEAVKKTREIEAGAMTEADFAAFLARRPGTVGVLLRERVRTALEDEPERSAAADLWLERVEEARPARRRRLEAAACFTQLELLRTACAQSNLRREPVWGRILLEAEFPDGTHRSHPLVTVRAAVEPEEDKSSEAPALLVRALGAPVFAREALEALADDRPLPEEAVFSLSKAAAAWGEPGAPARALEAAQSIAEAFEATGDGVLWRAIDASIVFTRERAWGAAESIERIAEHLRCGAPLPEPLRAVVCGEAPRAMPSGSDALDFMALLAETAGEDRDVLLVKPANAEQLAVVRALRNEPALLVQGPPGTGKTHTIANLIGHFLSEGKRVLVASHTVKALDVLRGQLPEELRALVVSRVSDADASVASLAEFTAAWDAASPERDRTVLEGLEIERRALFDDLELIRRTLFSRLEAAEKPLVVAGVRVDPETLGRSVATAKAAPDIGRLTDPAADFPLTNAEWQALGDTLAASEETMDESADETGWPDPAALPTAEDAKERLAQLARLRTEREADGLTFDEPEPGLVRVAHRGAVAVVLAKSLLTQAPDPTLAARFAQSLRFVRAAASNAFLSRVLGESLAGRSCEGYLALQTALEAAAASTRARIEVLAGRAVDASEETLDDPEYAENLEWFARTFPEGTPGRWARLTHGTRFKLLDRVRISGRGLSEDGDFAARRAMLRERVAAARLSALWQSAFDAPFEALELRPTEVLERYGSCLSRAATWFSEEWVPALEALRIDASLLPDPRRMSPEGARRVWLETVIPFVETLLRRRTIEAEIRRIEAPLAAARSALAAVANTAPETGARAAAELHAAYADAHADCAAALDAYARWWRGGRRTALSRRALEARLAAASPALAARWCAQGAVLPAYEDARAVWRLAAARTAYERLVQRDPVKLEALADEYAARLLSLTRRVAALRAGERLRERVENESVTAVKWACAAYERVRRSASGASETAHRAAERALAAAREVVPVWIMTIDQALESVAPERPYDVVIVDEASQADVVSAALLAAGKRVVVAGDDRQVSPTPIGPRTAEVEALMKRRLADAVEDPSRWALDASLYDLVKPVFRSMMLKEHFRSVPEITGFSNALCYGGAVLPLRAPESTPVRPAFVLERVNGVRGSDDRNEAEAEAIASFIERALADPVYAGKTFGVIVMRTGRAKQIEAIERRLIERIPASVRRERRIVCGLSKDFQGDERDVILLSTVDSASGERETLPRENDRDGMATKRWNVAVSRARDQVRIVHSFDWRRALQPEDVRRRLFAYVAEVEREAAHSPESLEDVGPLEREVARALLELGFDIRSGVEVGHFRVGLVAVGARSRAMLECGGDLRYAGSEKVLEDIERRTMLRRAGWPVLRMTPERWGADPLGAAEALAAALASLGIEPSLAEKGGSEPSASKIGTTTGNLRAVIETRSETGEVTEREAEAEKEPKAPWYVAKQSAVLSPEERETALECARLLVAVKQATGWTHAEIGARLGITAAYAGALASAKRPRKPSDRLLARVRTLARECGVAHEHADAGAVPAPASGITCRAQ